MEIMIIGVAAVIVVIILIATVVSVRSGSKEEIKDRLDRYTADYNTLLAEIEQEEQETRRRQQEQSAITKQLDKAIEQRDFSRKWRDQLARADLKITPGEYLAAHVLAVILGFLIGFFILLPGNAVIGIAVAVLGFFTPRFYVGFRKGKRINTFEQQLPDTIGLWVNGLRSGYSVQQAMEAISREGPEPTASEFRRVVQEFQLGVSRETALEHLLNRMPSDDLDLIITAVNIQAEVGGNLAEILDIIGDVIRDRVKLKGEIRVLTAQGRITGYVIGGIPFILSGVLMLLNPGYMGLLFSNQTCGWPMLFCVFALVGTGFAVINKIVQIDI
ncbi:MAG: type II secretion system F family protein [Chloroflexi bacterium]|nr:type II secretion system F family protein [Chloroflexota bacterium]